MNVGILGCGAFGFALCDILVENKNKVTMWTYSEDEKDMLVSMRSTPKLPDYTINNSVFITDLMDRAVTSMDLVVVAVPAFAFENTIKNMKKYISKSTPVLIATKGIQQDTCLFLHEIFSKYLSNDFAVISGPTFAKDIVSGSQVGFSLATKKSKTENVIRKCFSNERTKFRRSKDIVGVEICASVKNVIAIASGMLEGMGASDSTRALFLTESLNDVKELIHALGGKKKTILSFAGFGDILMTCTSKTSRNFSFGYLIGKGATKKEIDVYTDKNTVEGLYTLKSIHKLVRRKKVKMPIINLIYDIIDGKKKKEELLKFLIEK